MAASSESDAETIDGPLLTPGLLQRREYQAELADAALRDHTLVCLPTGLGKTAVSLLVTAQRLHETGGKSLLLAPTKPLVNQHADFYREALTIPDDDIVVFTGSVRPDDRAELWESAQVVVATPQVVENDLVGNRISLEDVTHLTFDECHRATGDYAYCYIAERYHADAADPLVTGMSASPGGDKEEILVVCENLGLREVEVMTEGDSDVSEFTHKTEVEWERVELPEGVIEIRDALNEVITDRLEKLKQLGVTRSTNPEMSQRDLNSIRSELQKMMSNDQSEGYQGMSAHAEIMKLRRAVELVETQSVESLRRYFERQRNAARSSGASKASQRFVSDPRVQEAMRRAEQFDDLHPKFRRARILLAQTLGIEEGERVIVFTESRDTAETLTEFFGEHFETHRFVGQGDKEGSDGMTQKQQQETLDAFRNGEFEVLVSTSVAEEGLDVPEVDLVLFYEPVPKGIRAIQRKGRTGRQTEGKVHVLLAEDTRDEAYFWISRREEKRMEEELRKLKGVAGEVNEELGQHGLDEFESANEAEATPDASPAAAQTATNGGADATDDPSESDDSVDTKSSEGAKASTGNEGGSDGQSGLDAFAGREEGGGERHERASDSTLDDATDTDDGPGADATVATARGDGDTVEIVVDQRELDSTIARDLSTRDGITTRLETLAVGDYVLSDRVVVERKSVDDFLDTLVGGDRSMFEQVKDGARHYSRPVVVVEGEDLYGARNVHPNAIRGALASLAIDFGASILRTTDEADTADLVEVIARREQEESDREVSVHGEKAAKTLDEQQEYVVGSIADVGPVTARALLTHFGSVEAVMTANEEDLLEVKGVGAVTAERIREVVGSDYE
ncbi:DEAD/DEAH box helicase [Halomarina rubra]|uniref:DEAD/DEAH box helicase n=1 Tax=Halomarina rubra TaxID=2071873 RepID=A0ABD6AWC3_9EURY|nr:DEAD/DEAH box helicase [Halomarina rubra]